MNLPTSPDFYTSFLRESFAIDRPGATPLELTLTQVTRTFENDAQLAFQLTFEGAGDFLPQGTYLLRHPRQSIDGLFLVPAARTKTGFLYIASFNLLKSPP